MTTKAADYRQEFTKVGDGLADTCRDLMTEFINLGDFDHASSAAEMGDMVGHVLATLTRLTDQLP